MLESIAFIPDGNRRYAKLAGISLAESYAMGTHKAWEVLQWLSKYPSITTGTFYTFSLKNFQRSKLELSLLFRIFEKELDQIKSHKFIPEEGIKINFIGKRELFPQEIQKKMTAAENYTSQFGSRTINLALGYDGQTEIVDASKKFAKDVAAGKISPDSLTPETFNAYLYADFKAPDLIVRTSNEQRLSGFLAYQSAYSELAFVNKYWPQLTEADVDSLVHNYDARERRFGK